MSRPSKTLEDRIADNTFESRRPAHRFLLESASLVRDPTLRKLQLRYRQTKAAWKKVDLAREFERLASLGAPARERRTAGQLEEELAKLGPQYSAKRAIAFFPRFLTLENGSPFKLEKWEREVSHELFRRTPDDRRVHKKFTLGIPRGNGKTPYATGLGILNLLEADTPAVFQAAGSKEQARVGTEFAGRWIDDGDLASWLIAKASSIEQRTGRGFYRIASADGRMLHGRRPSKSLLDEWWLMETRREEQVEIAMVTALAKDAEAVRFATTTAGYNKMSQLGLHYTAMLEQGTVEYQRQGFLRIARDLENGACLWWYGMPEGYELDLENDKAVLKALRFANPSSFVDVGALLRLLRSPGTDVYEWLRLHLNFWTQTRDSWLPLGCWAALREHEPIPAGAPIWVAVDAAKIYDTTAVCWAARMDDGRILVQGRAWAARDGAPAHERHDGGRICNRDVMEWIDRELGGRYKIREIVADPKFFDDYVWELGERGYLVAEFAQNSGAMRDAEQHFYQRATAGELAWYDPAGVMAAHVEATSARTTRHGIIVENPDKSRPIDLATAAIMASERCALAERQGVFVYEKRGLSVLGGPSGAKKTGRGRDVADEERDQRSQSLPYDPELARRLGLDVPEDDEEDADELVDVEDHDDDDR